MQLGNGTFAGKQIISAQNSAFLRTPKVALNDQMLYALGWVVQQTPNGNVVWHNGGTSGFGAYVGFLPDRNFGVVVLTNVVNVGLRDAIGAWTIDRLIENPEVDHVGEKLRAAKAHFEQAEQVFAKPSSPRPIPRLEPLVGRFENPSMGEAAISRDGTVLVMHFPATGASLRLEPWDGEVFTFKLMPVGRFAAVVEDLGPNPNGFAQFQIDKAGKLDALRLIFDDGQSYEFRCGT